jgi:hypothetical protein
VAAIVTARIGMSPMLDPGTRCGRIEWWPRERRAEGPFEGRDVRCGGIVLNEESACQGVGARRADTRSCGQVVFDNRAAAGLTMQSRCVPADPAGDDGSTQQ